MFIFLSLLYIAYVYLKIATQKHFSGMLFIY